MRLGIDFGTTRTVVAVSDRGNFPVVSFEKACGDLVPYFPSVVATDGDHWHYGHDATDVLQQPRFSGLRSFKRSLAGAGAQSRLLTIGTASAPLLDVLVGFLSALRRALVERSDLVGTEDEPLEAVIGIPARASSAQRLLTLEAFRTAGFVVVGMLNEPSAAGVEYAHRFRKTLTSRREDVLVYDLGGGTFDLSRVRLADRRHEVLAHTGLNDLGGDDFDHVLAELALRAADLAPKDLSTDQLHRVVEHCREQKEALHANSRKVHIELPDDRASVIAAADFYAAVRPLVQRSLDVLPEVLDATTDLDSIAGVYVVGGASALPVVARTLREAFARRVKRSSVASASTAVGLAIAASGAAPVIRERFSRTFGVFREIDGGRDVVFDPILTPDLTIEADGSAFVRRYRPVHNIGHLSFVECERLVDGVPEGDVVPVGEIRFAYDPRLRQLADLRAVAVERRGHGPVMEERYEVCASGVVSVRLIDTATGYCQEHRLHA